MIILDASIVNIALPHAQAALHISDASRQWALTAYTLTFGGLLLLGGRIADYLGRKRIFLVGLFGFAAASALGGAAQYGRMALRRPCPAGRLRRRARARGALADHHHLHRAARARQGVRRLRRHLRRRRRRRTARRWCCSPSTSAGAGPCSSTSPIAIAVAIASFPLLKESRVEGDRQYDVPGALLATLGLASAGLRIHRGVAALVDGAPFTSR